MDDTGGLFRLNESPVKSALEYMLSWLGLCVAILVVESRIEVSFLFFYKQYRRASFLLTNVARPSKIASRV